MNALIFYIITNFSDLDRFLLTYAGGEEPRHPADVGDQQVERNIPRLKPPP